MREAHKTPCGEPDCPQYFCALGAKYPMGISEVSADRLRLINENASLRSRVAQLEADLSGLTSGCQSHGCRIRKPSGQATNGPCQCIFNLQDYVLNAALSTPPSASEKKEEPNGL